MATIDKRIVDLQFNNAQFEKGVSETTKSLEELRKSLDNNTGALSGLDKLKVGFDALGVVGASVIFNLTSMVMDLGAQLINFATSPLQAALNQIISGGLARAQNLENARFLLMGLFKDEKKVEEVMSNALAAVKGTAFGLDDAAKAAAQFAAAGVKEGEDMIQILQGVAGVAALTNSEFSDIARIFTNVAGTGRVTRNELNQLASRGINPFILMAEEMGVSVEQVQNILRDPKTQLGADVFFKTFSQFAEHAKSANKTFSGSLSNMKAALSRIGANVATPALENLRDVFNALTPVIDSVNTGLTPFIELLNKSQKSASEFAVKLLGSLDVETGMNTVIKMFFNLLTAVKNVGKGITQILSPIKAAFSSIFPPKTFEQLIAFAEKIAELTSHFKISEATSDKLRRTFAGLFAAVDILISVFKILIGFVVGVGKVFAPIGSIFLSVTATIGDYIVALREGASASEIFQTVLGKLRDILSKAADGVKSAVERIEKYFGQFGGIDLGPLEIFSDKTKVMLSPMMSFADVLGKAFSAIKKAIGWVAPYVEKFALNLGNAFKKIGEVVGGALGITGIDGFLTVLNAILTSGVLVGIKGFIESLTKITNNAGGFLSNLKGILDGVRGSLEAYQTKIKSGAILNIAIAIGVLAGALWVLSTIKIGDMEAAMVAITVLFTELSAVMTSLSKNMIGIKMTVTATAMTALSVAVLLLSAAMKIVSKMDWEEIAKGLTGVTLMLTALVVSARALGNGKGLISLGLSIIPIATGLTILAGAMAIIALLDWEGLTKGLLGVYGVLAAIAIASTLVDPVKLMSMGVSLVGIGVALDIIAAAMAIISLLDWEGLTKGLLGIYGVLAAVAIASTLIDPVKLMAMGVSLVGISVGITALAGAMSIIALLDWEGLTIGLAGIYGILAGVAIASTIVNPVSLLTMGLSLVGIGVALDIMASALLIVANLSWEDLLKGFLVLTDILLMVSLMSTIANPATLLAMGAALIGLGVGFTIFAGAMAIMGALSWKSIAKGLTTFAVAVVALVGAGYLLAGVTPALLAFGASIALLGVGVLALGVGLGLCAAAMTVFAASGVAGAAAITLLGISVIGLIPLFLQKLGEGLVLVGQVILGSIPLIMDILASLIDGILELTIGFTPKIMEWVGVLFTSLLDFVVEKVPEIVVAFMELTIGILNGIAEKLPELISAGWDLVISLVSGIADGISEKLPALIDSFWDMVEAITDGIVYALEEGVPRLKENMSKVAAALWQAFKDFLGLDNLASSVMNSGAWQIIQGIVNGLKKGIETVKAAIKNVASAIWDKFKSFFGIHSPSTLMEEGGGNICKGLKNGLNGGITDLANKAKELGEKIFNGIKGAVSDIGSVASNLCSTLKTGLENGLEKVGSAAKNVGNTILGGLKGVLGIHSPATTMIEAARYIGEGLQIGLKDILPSVENSSEKVGNTVLQTMENTLSCVTDILNSDFDLTPTISPVIDMSDVTKGLNSAFNRRYDLDLNGIRANAQSAYLPTIKNTEDATVNQQKLIDGITTKLDTITNVLDSILNASDKDLVLDTGVLVGSTAGKMETAIADINRRKGR